MNKIIKLMTFFSKTLYLLFRIYFINFNLSTELSDFFLTKMLNNKLLKDKKH